MISLVDTKPKPHKAAIEMLEGFLKRAKEGEFAAVFILAQCPDGSVIDGWVSPRGTHAYTCYGAMMAMAEEFRETQIQKRM